MYLRADTPEEQLEPAASEAVSYREARENGGHVTSTTAGFLALVSELNAPGGDPFGGTVGHEHDNGVEFSAAATPDLSHVVFYSYRAAPGIYEWGPRESCNREEFALCTGGDVQPVSVLPGGTLATGRVELGGAEGVDTRHAISNDGALVFWMTIAGSSQQQHLYVRDSATEETLQLDVAQPGASGAGASIPQFETASADGSKVFFTDTQRLTPDSKAGTFHAQVPDLYVAELSGGAPGSRLSETLTDLTPQGINGESAYIQEDAAGGGGVLGASEDGSYIYFVANGALTPGATRGYCSPEVEERPSGTTCNLYVARAEGGKWARVEVGGGSTPTFTTKLIAALSDEDRPDWGGVAERRAGSLDALTSRVSPNGQYLAFMSDRPLTGYDNEDHTSEQPGEKMDEEVFLYDASSERIVCASCNPTGKRPAGVFDEEGETLEEGEGLLVDRFDIWSEGSEGTDHWLAGSVPGWTPLSLELTNYQSRYLSNEGRLFFDSPDHLVQAATGVAEKVYEYEPDGLGSCHSEAGCVGLLSPGSSEHEAAFLDASVSGNDVFFITADQVLPQDKDKNFDIYDAHVCEASAPCPPASAEAAHQCGSVENCRPGEYPVPSSQAPASTSVSVSGNLARQQVLAVKVVSKPKPLTRAQKLAKALKACKKDKKKSKRLACEKQAKKKYGPVKKKAKKSSVKGRRG
jgi:hypothetical protein